MYRAPEDYEREAAEIRDGKRPANPTTPPKATEAVDRYKSRIAWISALIWGVALGFIIGLLL